MSMLTEFEVLSFDRIAFAHSLAAMNYKCTLQNQGYGIYGETPKNGGVLEVGFVEQNPIILTGTFGEYRVSENCIFIIPPNTAFSVHAETSSLHRHTSAEFLISCHCRRTEACPPPSGKTITLPLIIPPSQGSSEIFTLIRSIARAKTAQSNRSHFEECADFMMLMCKLASLVRDTRDTDTVSPANRRYCERAKAFISENIDRRLTVTEVAKAAGISKNYLTNVFSSSEGMSLVEYINRRKLSYMMELIRRYEYTLAEAGEHVGFTDVNYISRIFKRYYGITVTEYKQSFEMEESV